jgi:acetyl esterase
MQGSRLEPGPAARSTVAGIVILSVDYRLAPERPFPPGLDDALAAVAWAAGHTKVWSGDTGRLAISGDGAGANLAAVAANRPGGQPYWMRSQENPNLVSN